MRLQAIKQAILTTLGAGAGGQFRVVGYGQRSQDELTVKGLSRSVQVVYTSGEFPRSSNSLYDPACHKMTYSILLTVSAPCYVDVATLESPSATAGQRAAALAAIQQAEFIADRDLDDLWARVFDVLMSGLNIDFGLSYTVGSRELNNYTKRAPKHNGQYVVAQASCDLMCQIDEPAPGAEPLAAEDPAVSLAIQYNEEPIARMAAGVNAPKEYANGLSGAAKTIDWSRAAVQSMTLSANCAVTHLPSSANPSMVLRVGFPDTTARTLTNTNTIYWHDGSPGSPTCDPDYIDYYYYAYDGTRIFGAHHLAVPIV